jgi:hypothetical protein
VVVRFRRPYGVRRGFRISPAQRSAIIGCPYGAQKFDGIGRSDGIGRPAAARF